MESKQKVLFVATVVRRHINVFHLPFLAWFKERGYETHVAARDDFEGEVCEVPYCDVYHNVPFDRSPFSVQNKMAYKQLKQLIVTNNYAIIHCHTPVAAMLTRIAARKARKKGTRVIYTAHGFHFYKGAPIHNWMLYYPMEKWLSRYTDCLITINKEDYDLAKKKMKAVQVAYVPGVGIDIEKGKNIVVDRLEKRKELGVPSDAIMFLSVGEISKRKNHEVAIRALAKLDRKDVYYVLCGYGQREAYLKELSISLGIAEQVLFVGHRSDVVEIGKRADVFVFPSLQEGLPVALMEAMSVGLPCIVSDIRGNKDLIKEDKGGILCAKDSTEDFYAAMKYMIANKLKWIEMGRINQKSLEPFSREKVMEVMSEIYKKGSS